MLKCSSKRKFTVLVTVIFMLFISTMLTFADTNYTTDEFNVDVKARANDEFQFTETINVNFFNNQHGLFRFIPLNDGKMKVKEISVEGYDYSVYEEDNNKVIRIGSEDEYVKGKQTYVIHYTIAIADDKNEEGDFLYLDILPTNWDTLIGKTNISLTMPKAFDHSNLNIYSGKYGEKANNSDVVSRYIENKNQLIIEGNQMPKGSGVTVQADLPEGYWENPYNYDYLLDYIPMMMISVVVILLVFWFMFGRDPKIIETVEFYPPKGLNSAEIGYIVDGHLEKKDMISLIFYLAEKGYLEIEEDKSKEEMFLLEKNPIPDSEKPYIKTFCKGIFAKGKKRVKIDELDEKFTDAYAASQEMILAEYAEGKTKIYSNSSKLARALGTFFMAIVPTACVIFAAIYAINFTMIFAAIPVIILSVAGALLASYIYDKRNAMAKNKFAVSFMLSYALMSVACAISAVLIVILTEKLVYGIMMIVFFCISSMLVVLMRKRTKESVEVVGKVLGFRNFIETAEIPKLEMLVEENPGYFYNVLPYAYVLGLSDKWTKKFENIKMSYTPNWYVGGNINSFDLYWYSRMMRNMHTTVPSITLPDAGDVGLGGFGGGGFGGGFSGGGFGGGGGGAW